MPSCDAFTFENVSHCPQSTHMPQSTILAFPGPPVDCWPLTAMQPVPIRSHPFECQHQENTAPHAPLPPCMPACPSCCPTTAHTVARCVWHRLHVPASPKSAPLDAQSGSMCSMCSCSVSRSVPLHVLPAAPVVAAVGVQQLLPGGDVAGGEEAHRAVGVVCACAKDQGPGEGKKKETAI